MNKKYYEKAKKSSWSNMKRYISLPFSANGASTSKIISLLSCSVCFLKSFTSSSAMFVLANCSLLDSAKSKKIGGIKQN